MLMTAALACAACGSTSSPGPSYAAGGEGGAALGSAGPAGAVCCRVGQRCDDQTCADAPFCLIDAGCSSTERCAAGNCEVPKGPCANGCSNGNFCTAQGCTTGTIGKPCYSSRDCEHYVGYCDLLFSGECRRLCESTRDCQQMSEYSYAQAFKQTYESCSPSPVPAAGARHDSETSTSRRRQTGKTIAPARAW